MLSKSILLIVNTFLRKPHNAEKHRKKDDLLQKKTEIKNGTNDETERMACCSFITLNDPSVFAIFKKFD